MIRNILKENLQFHLERDADFGLVASCKRGEYKVSVNYPNLETLLMLMKMITMNIDRVLSDNIKFTQEQSVEKPLVTPAIGKVEN